MPSVNMGGTLTSCKLFAAAAQQTNNVTSSLLLSQSTEHDAQGTPGTSLIIGRGELRTTVDDEESRESIPMQSTAFLQKVVTILVEYIRESNDRKSLVVQFHHPDELRQLIGHMLQVGVGDSVGEERLLEDCRETLKYCVRTGHPRFFNQISSGLDIVGLAAEWLTAVANTNVSTYEMADYFPCCSSTYEMAPVFALMEQVVLQKMRHYVGWKDGEGDGIFAPGGAISNLYGVEVARQRVLPNCKTEGLSGTKRLVMFTSEQSHFSIKRAGVLLGIGADNVIFVRADHRGKMIIEDLEEKIAQARRDGGHPFLVAATAATTVLGSFDPFDDIADVCEKHDLWFHVDAAWGGGLLLSSKYKHILHGVHRANSVTWNPHKLMGVELQCSAILVRDKGTLETCNSLRSIAADWPPLDVDGWNYEAAEYDTVDKSIQTSRHVDVFKVWLMWRAKGPAGFERHIDQLMTMSKYVQQQIRERDGFVFVLDQPEYLNVCFWYVPRRLRHLAPAGEEWTAQIELVAPKIKAHLMNKGNALVGYQPLGEIPNFFRMILSNMASTTDDVNQLLDEIAEFGELSNE